MTQHGAFYCMVDTPLELANRDLFAFSIVTDPHNKMQMTLKGSSKLTQAEEP